MMETIKKAQQVGVKVKELQEELQNTEVEATSEDGGVTVVVSGAQVPISVVVSDEMLAKGAAAVSEAVSVAAKEAHTNSMQCTLPSRRPARLRARPPAWPCGRAAHTVTATDVRARADAKDRMTELYGEIGLPMPGGEGGPPQ